MILRPILGLGLALGLFALVGCAGEEEVTMDDVASPSEGARVINQNPSAPTIDVPATPENEAAQAEAQDEAEGQGEDESTQAGDVSPTEPSPEEGNDPGEEPSE